MNVEVREFVLHLVERGEFDGYTVEEFEGELEDMECSKSSDSYQLSSDSLS